MKPPAAHPDRSSVTGLHSAETSALRGPHPDQLSLPRSPLGLFLRSLPLIIHPSLPTGRLLCCESQRYSYRQVREGRDQKPFPRTLQQTAPLQFPWWSLWCWWRFELWRKHLPQWLHWYGFSPVWILWCSFRVDCLPKQFPHSPQM